MTIHQPSRSSQMLAMFRAGKDTKDIADKLGVEEAVVYNAIGFALNQSLWERRSDYRALAAKRLAQITE